LVLFVNSNHVDYHYYHQFIIELQNIMKTLYMTLQSFSL